MSALQELSIDLNAELASTQGGRADKAASGGISGWVASLPIGKKIIVFFSGNLLVAIAAAVVILLGLYDIYSRNTAINETRGHLLAAQHIVSDFDTARLEIELFAQTGSEADRSAAVGHLDEARGELRELEGVVGQSSGVLSQQVVELEEASNALQQDLRGLDAGDAQATRAIVASLEQGSDNAQAVVATLGDRVEALSDSISARIWNLLTVWGSLVFALCLTGLYTQYYFNRHVGRAIEEQAEQMRRLANGERDFVITGEHRRDEIGIMASTLRIFQRASARLERLSAERAEKARIELEAQAQAQRAQEEARIERERSLRDLANQFERTVGEVVGSVASASSQLQATSTMMAATAEQASDRTTEVSTWMDEANAGATAAAAASDEFAMSIGEISRQAASSAELARKASNSANEADATISALADSAEQVGQIVELIQTIAQRTNLLALNASIEAARGGEAGRGFAVVASEVKELAMQTSRATGQVAEQIRAMQDTTGASVKALRSIAQEVAQLESTAVSIASAVDQQSVAGQDLARSIDLAARGTEQVSGHIKEVRELSISTGSAASQVLSSATALEQQASVLRIQVDGFLQQVRAG